MNESAGEKLWKSRSHSFNNNKLDDRDHFQQNAKTSVASLRGLIGSSRNIDRPHSGMLIGFIGIPIFIPGRSVVTVRAVRRVFIFPGCADEFDF